MGSQPRRGEQPNSHSFAMREPEVASRLQPVSKGMAEVECQPF